MNSLRSGVVLLGCDQDPVQNAGSVVSVAVSATKTMFSNHGGVPDQTEESTKNKKGN